MIEFVVGLVALLVVFAGLLQIGRIAKEHTNALLEARKLAGAYAMSDGNAMTAGPLYIQDWSEGNDGHRYSRDDRAGGGDVDAVPEHVAIHGRPDDLAGWIGDNDVTDLYRAERPLTSFGFVQGHYRSDPIPLLSAIRNLLYDADSIEVEADVYMIWTRGIY